MLKDTLINTIMKQWAKQSGEFEDKFAVGEKARLVDSKFKQFLKDQLKSMEVLTKDEFEQYEAALTAAEKRIEQLNQKIEELESKLKQQ